MTKGIKLKIEDKEVQFTLISRKEKYRVGMRFLSRGVDIDGNVSNFVETEHIVGVKSDNNIRAYSYIQIRGSIPIFWKQEPTMSWSPKVSIEANKEKNKTAYKLHMQTISGVYGPTVLVNLIDKKGTQLKIGQYFKEIFESCPIDDSKYVWFDFHHECRNMQWDNISKLINGIKEDLERYGFSYCTIKVLEDSQFQATVSRRQSGVIRTNCIDCLDRTNVVQSVIGRIVLLNQLYEVIYQYYLG